jgi:hypothetical protein
MVEKKLNVSINEGEAFFAHELAINFNPSQFIFDFKSVTPRVDPRSQQSPVIAIKHNVILLEPYHMKKIAELMGTVIQRYEDEFGKIEKPKALERYEKKRKSMVAENELLSKPMTPDYFG